MSDESVQGSEAYWWADGPVRDLILDQGRLRVESTFATLTSLNSRLGSLGGLLFAGAALTTSIATNVDKLSVCPTIVASIASAFFAAGGLASFVGIASGKSIFAGEPPSWWAIKGLHELREMGEQDAKYWIAGHQEAEFKSLSAAVSRRGLSLNCAAVLGAIGGVLVPVSAVAALMYPRPVLPPPSAINLHIEMRVPASGSAAYRPECLNSHPFDLIQAHLV